MARRKNTDVPKKGPCEPKKGKSDHNLNTIIQMPWIPVKGPIVSMRSSKNIVDYADLLQVQSIQRQTYDPVLVQNFKSQQMADQGS